MGRFAHDEIIECCHSSRTLFSIICGVYCKVKWCTWCEAVSLWVVCQHRAATELITQTGSEEASNSICQIAASEIQQTQTITFRFHCYRSSLRSPISKHTASAWGTVGFIFFLSFFQILHTVYPEWKCPSGKEVRKESSASERVTRQLTGQVLNQSQIHMEPNCTTYKLVGLASAVPSQ